MINKDKMNKNIEISENDLEKMENIFKENKKLPKVYVNFLNKEIFLQSFIFAIIMLVYVFLLIGYNNINKASYIVDLKVFSVIGLGIVILLLEYSYKKDSVKSFLIGIEILIGSIVVLSLPHILIYDIFNYINFLNIVLLCFFGYYILKILAIFVMYKRKYNKKENEIKKIIKKEEI